MRTYYNILQKHSGILMLGMSVDTREQAQAIIDKNYSNARITELNVKRWKYSNSPLLPLNDYSVIETRELYTI